MGHDRPLGTHIYILYILQILYIYMYIYLLYMPLSLSRKDSTGRNLISYWLMTITVSGWLSHVKPFQTCFFFFRSDQQVSLLFFA